MVENKPGNPCIVQSDCTLLLEIDNPLYPEARNTINRFAELIKSPDKIHTYRMTPLSIWNAYSSGVTIDEMIQALALYSKFGIPKEVVNTIRENAARFGKVRIFGKDKNLFLSFSDEFTAKKLTNAPEIAEFIGKKISDLDYKLPHEYRGKIKQLCIKRGYPVHDLAGYGKGESLSFSLKTVTQKGKPFLLRSYQEEAAAAFYKGGAVHGGSGVVVLPCGAGKTIVGISCMHKVQACTLILSSCRTSLKQWRKEILDKTTLTEDQVGEYSGTNKKILPVTISSYQILSYKDRRNMIHQHLELFKMRNWGLIIYDEVHLLPAPVFQITADLQTKRRLGLTATLVREDGREDEVFALVGPKKYDLPWKDLEKQGWIAKALCTEIRLPLEEDQQELYATADKRKKFRIASGNSHKLNMVKKLIKKHSQDQILIIGLYLDQLMEIAGPLNIPLLTGKTHHSQREEIYRRFKENELSVIAVSKIANFAIDLPDASVAIQISGTFGSRQEEAQRLGRILRPKEGNNQAFFYSLVTQNTTEQQFAFKRQRFLCEQGYDYRIISETDV
ncbi:MAG: helicase-associated domain-containing protein [Spirochaetales bacterium]|nr:helicase-associated domain-containing protein [Spirochaetales bacterium]